jgi:hypothetical protein
MDRFLLKAAGCAGGAFRAGWEARHRAVSVGGADGFPRSAKRRSDAGNVTSTNPRIK